LTRDEYIAMAAEAARAVAEPYWVNMSADELVRVQKHVVKLATAALDAVSSWETREAARELLDSPSCTDPDCCQPAVRHNSARARLVAVLDKVGK
jgi:hypothetical protein